MDDCCDANGSHTSYFIGKYGPYVAHGKEAAAEMALGDLLIKSLRILGMNSTCLC